MIWATVYNPAIDVIYPILDLSANTTFTDIESSIYPAGKGFNFAKVVQALGEEVSVMAIMPEADQQRFAEYMKQHDIDYHFFTVPGVVRINTTIYEKSSGMVQHYNSKGQIFTTQVQDLVEKEILSLLKEDDFWVLSGSIPYGMDSDAYARIISRCHDKNIPVALDTQGTPLQLGIQQHPTIITPNEEELLALYDEPVHGLQHLILKGKQLIDRDIPYVFITLGVDGIIALHKEQCLLCKAPDRIVLDTVGCGDAFLAGIVVGQVRGFSFTETCRLAVACGSANAQTKGPGEVDAEVVWRIMEQVIITEA